MKPSRSRLRRVLRGLGLGVAGLLVLTVVAVGAVLGILHTDWGREQLRARVEVAAGKFVKGTLRIGRLEGSVLGDVVLRDVTIDAANGDTVTLTAVRTNVGFTALTSGMIRIEHLVLEGLDIVAAAPPPAADGTQPPAAKALMKLADLIILDDEPLSWDVAVERIAVTGSLAWQGPDAGHLDALTVTGHVHVGAGAALVINGGIKLAARWRERGVDLAASGDVRLSSRQVVVQRARVALGGSSVEIGAAHFTRDLLAGIAVVTVAPDAWQLLVPTAPPVPAMRLTLSASEDRPGRIPIAIGGTVAGAAVRGAITLDEVAQRASGHLATTGFSPATLVAAAPAGTVAARLDLDLVVEPGAPSADLDAVRARALLHATIARAGAPVETVVIGVDVVDRALAIVAGATGPGGARARLAARGRLGDADLQIDAARLQATVPQLEAVLHAGPVTRGAITADVTASGAVGAQTIYAVSGTVTGRRLRLGLGGRPIAIDAVEVTARTRADGRFEVAARSTPRARTLVEASAVVDPAPEAITIALGRLRLRTPELDVGGRGGVVVIAPDRIAARDLQLALDGGTVDLTGTYHRGVGRRAAGDVDARARIQALELASIDRIVGLGGVRGRVDADLDGSVQAGRYRGEVDLAVRGLGTGRDASTLDVAASTRIEPRKLTLDGMARGAALGGAVFSIEAVPPRDLLDPAAWSRVDARAVKVDVRVGPVDGSIERALDLAELTRLVGVDAGLGGRLEGNVHLDEHGFAGRLAVRALTTPVAPDRIDAQLVLAGGIAAPTRIDATVDVAGIGTATASATVATPARPFDLVAWTRLDQRAVGAASLRAERIDLAPISARLALPPPWDRWIGRATVVVDVEPGLTGATARIAAEGVRVDPRYAPIDAEVTAAVHDDGLDATVAATVAGTPVLHGTAHVAVRAAALARGGLAVLRSAPVTATLGGERVPLATLLRAAGRRDRASGAVDLSATVAGTVAAPTGAATVAITGLRFDGKDLGALTAIGGWDGTTITGALTGVQPGGGRLALRGSAAPDRLDAASVSLDATGFDLGALTRLLPDPLEDIRGRLEADLRVRGLDPATAVASGIVRVRAAQLPLVPTLGTLRDGSIEVSIGGGHALVAIDGAIGAGKVALTGSATLAGLLPSRATLDVRASDIQMVTPLQPILSAVTHVEVKRERDRWRAAVTVRNGRVVVPDDDGQELAPTGLPTDLVFSDVVATGRATSRIGAGSRPRAPFLIADVTLEPIQVQQELVSGELIGRLTAQVGADAYAIDGVIETARADLSLVNRRYRIEEATVTFDGTLDPVLDIRISRAFPELTLFITASGRASAAAIVLRSDPATYSQSMLVGVVLGGSPGESTGEQIEGAALGAAAYLASGFVTKTFLSRLPFRVDSLAVEAPTSTSSAAVKAGHWLSRNLYVAVRRRLEARADQNATEGEFEYWLGRRLVLEGITGDNHVHGLDLLWTRRW